MKKICVIGHFGFGKELLNGQTIKTKIISSELEKQLGSDNVICMDLAGRLKRIPGFLIKIPGILAACDHVIIMPVENGLRFLTPLLGFWNFFFRRKLHYVVIGGWLPDFLKSHRCLARGLKFFRGIYVETHTMKHALEQQGFGNVSVMPNCKTLRILTEEELVYPDGIPLRLCTFSRVMKEKGIEDAVRAVIAVNSRRNTPVFTLDIYGQIESSQTEWFEALRTSFPDYIRYRGVVSFHETTEILKEYSALLFPTCYEGEGFAGTLLDAYSAGLPVIATDWKYNPELVSEETGFLYPTHRQDELVDILERVIANPRVLNIKKTACLKKASEYRSDKVIQILLRNFDH